MELETKRGPGRPPKVTEETHRPVRYVQVHDAFTPLLLSPVLSLSLEGAKAMTSLLETDKGIEVVHPSGREFVVPYGNISFYELQK